MARRLPEYGISDVGLVESVVVGEHRGHPIELRWHDDGNVHVKHLCDRRHGQRPDVAPHCVLLAPKLMVGPAAAAHARDGRRHVIRRDDDGAVWIAGSVACPDCDLHGMVEHSTWRPV